VRDHSLRRRSAAPQQLRLRLVEFDGEKGARRLAVPAGNRLDQCGTAGIAVPRVLVAQPRQLHEVDQPLAQCRYELREP